MVVMRLLKERFQVEEGALCSHRTASTCARRASHHRRKGYLGKGTRVSLYLPSTQFNGWPIFVPGSGSFCFFLFAFRLRFPLSFHLITAQHKDSRGRALSKGKRVLAWNCLFGWIWAVRDEEALSEPFLFLCGPQIYNDSRKYERRQVRRL